MNEGRQITKEQAEACMRADSQFCVRVGKNSTADTYFYGNETLFLVDPTKDEYSAFKTITERLNAARSLEPHIHADPNNTFERLFGSERELTFEEVGTALFRGETVHCDTGKLQYLLRLAGTSGDVFPELHIDWKCMDESGWALACNWSYQRDWKYTLYKEPTNPEPQPEPLTLESLEARVKALEERS